MRASDSSYIGLLILLVGTGLSFRPVTTLGQVDDQDRSFFTAAGSFSTGSADPAGSGFLYWNKVNWPWAETNSTIIWAGPFLEMQLTRTGVITPDTSVGVNVGGLGFVAGLPLQYIDGIPLRSQETDGTLVWGQLFMNHLVGEFTEYEIPLNLYAGYSVGYQEYSAADGLEPGFIVPSDPVRQIVELRAQLGGRRPVIRKQQALDLHVRYLYGHNSNWEPFGPVLAPYEAHANWQMLIGSAGASLPVAEGHYVGAFITGMQGWGLDRSTAFTLGGFLQRGRESTRIIGFYTGEFIVDQFVLVNTSYQFPLSDWQNLAGHLYLDYAYLNEAVEPSAGWRSALGLGCGISLDLPYNTALLLAYGYGANADRIGGSGRHEFVVQTEILFW